MKYRRVTNLLTVAAIAALGVSTATARAATWQGPGGLRGDGNWGDAANWSGSATPGSEDDVTIQGTGADDPADATTADIVIGQDDGQGGVTPIDAKAKTLTVQYGKTATLTLLDNSSLTVSGLVHPGGYFDTTYGSHLTVTGPASGNAVVSFGSVNLLYETPTANILTFSGRHLEVTSRGMRVQKGNVLTIEDGATLGIPTSQTLYIDTPGENNGLVGRMTIEDGTVTVGSVIAREGQLLQLNAAGTLNANVTIGKWGGPTPGSRFEAEGNGLNGTLQIDANAILAVGVADSAGTRSSAATFTLNNNVALQDNGHLEFGIFGAGGTDKSSAASLAGASNDLLSLDGNIFDAKESPSYGTVLLDVVTYGYTPQVGQTYQLIAGAGQTGTGYTFTLGNTDSSTWKIMQDATGLYVTRVPEPAGLGLLAFGGLLAVRRRKK